VLCWLAILTTVPTVHAADDDVSLDAAAREAEYRRLRDDLRKFAEKQMWSAVERNYLRCMELYPDTAMAKGQAWAPPTPMLQSDHLHAAQAAMTRGDLYEVRKRVVRAVRREQTAEALDWLWAIDTTYSEVDVKALPGTKLVAVKRPFDPRILRAIDFAATTLADTGHFHGLLPRLEFRVGETPLRVEGGKGLVELDLTDGLSEKQRRKALKKRNKAKAREADAD
jgi:hypothetical protein